MTFNVVDLREMLIRDAVCCQYMLLRGRSQIIPTLRGKLKERG